MTIGPQFAEFLYTITNFGEANLIAPPVCGAIAALWVVGERRNARILAIAFALCLAATVLSKIAFMFVYRGGPLRSPSGHTALAAFVYGSLAVLAWKRESLGALRYVVVALCAVVVLGVAVSRFKIGGHSRTETVFGLAYGVLAVAFLARRFAWRPLRSSGAALSAVVGLAVTLAAYLVLASGYFDEEAISDFTHWLKALTLRA
ncbi:MAG TPA: phosphatase PAP2 family protein [Rhodoblastus sp.]|nr:phosphatase PAP2 family protein [Rhodoblastus sp.]